jgi:uncharacterized membrane protein
MLRECFPDKGEGEATMLRDAYTAIPASVQERVFLLSFVSVIMFVLALVFLLMFVYARVRTCMYTHECVSVPACVCAYCRLGNVAASCSSLGVLRSRFLTLSK